MVRKDNGKYSSLTRTRFYLQEKSVASSNDDEEKGKLIGTHIIRFPTMKMTCDGVGIICTVFIISMCESFQITI